MTTPEVGQLQAELAGRILRRLPSRPWPLDALARVPRHRFLPDRCWRLADDGKLAAIDRTGDPAGWMEAAYSDDAIVTQLDRSTPTSSCSMPYIVVRMLELLDVQPGQRALEIGTGTGWSAALLADRLSDDQVVTVEVDPHLAEVARRNLAAAGSSATVVAGDGTAGHPAGAPYDRIIATCAVTLLPLPWVQQTAPGGAIVTPWGSPLGLGALLRLNVVDGAASGTFESPASFMWLRAQQPAMPEEPADFDQRADTARAGIDVAAIRDNLTRFAIGLLVPDCQAGGYWSGPAIWLFARDSWASAEVATGVVRQLGPRRLWDEIEAAYRWWVDEGRPDLTRFGITVVPDRQWIWLDEPDNHLPGVRS